MLFGSKGFTLPNIVLDVFNFRVLKKKYDFCGYVNSYTKSLYIWGQIFAEFLISWFDIIYEISTKSGIPRIIMNSQYTTYSTDTKM